ncbi:hypothetical protein EGR_06598 [Echinococcus granulosus]|uniref:Uncharacterized protein n=1 Tax=Echinococcus granulosus TaxID=6210 RepID=W6UY70_ECHGR|nr:hypothetical protein EGR_06598 [Echinococcus granulosus]EUB58509.1 hypothetical protein EGR_06598 [Echinococcus granulosus]
MEARKHGHPEIVQYLVCQDSNEEVPSADGSESRLAATSPAVRDSFFTLCLIALFGKIWPMIYLNDAMNESSFLWSILHVPLIPTAA